MYRLAHLLLCYSYFYSQLLGLIRFEYVHQYGRVRTRRALTVYSIIANCVLIAVVPVLYKAQLLQLLYSLARYFNQFIYLAITLIRLACVTTTILLNWYRRSEFIAVVQDFLELRRLYLHRLPIHPSLQSHHERCLIRKFCWGLLADLALWALTLDNVRKVLDWRLFSSITVLSMLTHILPVLINHYYYGILNICWYYAALNNQLERVLKNADQLAESENAIDDHRFVQLAEELDTLAIAHHQLHTLADRMNQVFNIQAAAVTFNVYLSNVGMFYLVYTFTKPHEQLMGMSIWGVGFLAATIVAYHCDVRELMLPMLEMLKDFQRTSELLRQYSPLQSNRLFDRSIESFLIQLARNPLVLSQWGMYNFDQQMGFIIFVSALNNSVFLIQYDYEHIKSTPN